MPPPKAEHCSAFAATGPATADGKIVFGHITMFGLYPSGLLQRLARRQAGEGPPRPDAVVPRRHPERHGLLPERRRPPRLRDDHRPDPVRRRRHRPGQRASARRCSTATRSTRRSRSSRTATTACTRTSGSSRDTKTNEIAMFELGTHSEQAVAVSRRTSGSAAPRASTGAATTRRTLQVRLDTIADLDGRPQHTAWRPADRDKKWLAFYEKHKGKIDGRVRHGGVHHRRRSPRPARSTPSSRRRTWRSS